MFFMTAFWTVVASFPVSRRFYMFGGLHVGISFWLELLTALPRSGKAEACYQALYRTIYLSRETGSRILPRPHQNQDRLQSVSQSLRCYSTDLSTRSLEVLN